MNQEIKAKWVADLRAHPKLQGSGRLVDKTGRRYCCLGRLAKICGLKKDEKFGFKFEVEPTLGFLGQDFLDEIGLTAEQQNWLVDKNDTYGMSFNQIADYIEKEI